MRSFGAVWLFLAPP